MEGQGLRAEGLGWIAGEEKQRGYIYIYIYQQHLHSNLPHSCISVMDSIIHCQMPWHWQVSCHDLSLVAPFVVYSTHTFFTLCALTLFKVTNSMNHNEN